MNSGLMIKDYGLQIDEWRAEGDLQRSPLNLPYTVEYQAEIAERLVTLTLALSRSRERGRPQLMITAD